MGESVEVWLMCSRSNTCVLNKEVEPRNVTRVVEPPFELKRVRLRCVNT